MALLTLGCECTPDCPPISGTPGPPGPTGPAGPQGPAGIDGENAFGITTAPFVVPNVGANVNVAVDPASWATPTQVVYIMGVGYYQVAAVSTLSVMVLTNLGYPNSLTPGSQVGTGLQVSPAGVRGAQGPPWVLTSPLGINLGGTAGATAQQGFDNLSPLTAPGQIISYDGAHNVAVASSGSNQVLISDTTVPAGVRFTPAADLAVSFDEIAPTQVKGDLIVYGSSNTNERLAAPNTLGLVLTSDPSAEPGVSWQPVKANSFGRQSYAQTPIVLAGTESLVAVSIPTNPVPIHIVLGPVANYQTSMVLIKDESGQANQYPITITTSDGTLIQGQTQYVIDIPYGKVFIYSDGLQQFFLI